MTTTGTVEHGRIILARPLDMPDGTSVEIWLHPLPVGFWSSSSLAELAHQQEVPALSSAIELAGDWPDSDSVDDLIAAVHEGRA